MSKKTFKSQLTNLYTFDYYLQKCYTLAASVFQITNLPEFIDISYVQARLVTTGSIAFFRDEVLGLLAFPYTVIKRDAYNRPTSIIAMGENGYRKTLTNNIFSKHIEFVIYYDNIRKRPLYPSIIQHAERLAMLKRTIDINENQQKTPRLWQAPQEMVTTLKSVVNNVDSFNESIVGFDNFKVDEINCILEPAPYIADKVREEFAEEWSEFLQLIGVASNTNNKKERLITDEVRISQGGTIASRFSRFATQSRAIEQINKYLLAEGETPLELTFYDGLPTTLVDIESEVLDDVYTNE